MVPESWVRATLIHEPALMDWATRVAVVKSGLFNASVSDSFWFRSNGISRSTLAPWTTRPTVGKFFRTLSPVAAPTEEPAGRDRPLRDRVHLPVGALERGHHEGPALQRLGVADRVDQRVQPAAGCARTAAAPPSP